MVRRFSVNFAIFAIGIDLVCVLAMLAISGHIRPALDDYIPGILSLEGQIRLNMALFIIFPLVWVLLLLLLSTYDGQKNLRLVDEFTSLTFGSLLAGITLAGILYLSYRDVSRALFIFFVLSTYLSLIAWRIPARLLYRQRRNHKVRSVLILGAGPVGLRVEESLKEWQHNGIDFVGFLDDNPEKKNTTPRMLGSTCLTRDIVKTLNISDVVVALPLRAYTRIATIAQELEKLPVKIWVVQDFFHLSLYQASMAHLADIPMLDLRASALSEYDRMLKRAFDLVIVSLILIPALPLMGLVALIIWLFDGRPVLFTQKRVGENGHIFKIHKFRTMVRNADKMLFDVCEKNEQGNLIHKKKNDPRVTTLGRFLRRFSLDELPQLFNIFSGNMSLVGPRPELPELVELYEPWQRQRLTVPQGLTGWWQTNGRSDKPMHLHTEDDLYYVRNYSIWLDIQILVKTFWVVVKGKGAY